MRRILIAYNADTLAAWGDDFVTRVEAGLRPLGEVRLWQWAPHQSFQVTERLGVQLNRLRFLHSPP